MLLVTTEYSNDRECGQTFGYHYTLSMVTNETPPGDPMSVVCVCTSEGQMGVKLDTDTASYQCLNESNKGVE